MLRTLRNIQKIKLILTSFVVLFAMQTPVFSNQQPKCAPLSVAYDFPIENEQKLTRSIELKFHADNICTYGEHQIVDFVIKEVLIKWGSEIFIVPSRCITTEPVDIGSILIEKDGGPSIRIKERDTQNSYAFYLFADEFICMKFP